VRQQELHGMDCNHAEGDHTEDKILDLSKNDNGQKNLTLTEDGIKFDFGVKNRR